MDHRERLIAQARIGEMANVHISPRTEKNFWRHVEKTDSCWLWRGASSSGYGSVCIGWFGTPGNPVLARAPRVSWVLHRGELPPGLLVLHHCDNPRCVNPAHLFLGTQKDNRADAVRKGRASGGGLCGERNPSAKLTLEKAAEIRRLLAAGESQRAVARKMGVAQSTIGRVKEGSRWVTA